MSRPAEQMTLASSDPDSVPVSSSRRLVLAGSLLGLLLIGVVIVLLREQLLPARFFYDGDTIQVIAQQRGYAQSDFSYQAAASVYRLLGLADDATAAALVSFAAYLVVLAAACRGLMTTRYPRSAVVLVGASVVFGAIYLGTYSKDVMLAPVVAVVLLTRRSWLGELAIIASICAYAEVFRTYWFIIAVTYIALRLALRWRPRVRTVVLVGLLLAGCAAVAMSIVLGVAPDSFRTSSNTGRVDSADAASTIPAFIPGGTLASGTINIVLALVSLALPLPLALKGGAYFLALSALIGVFWIRAASIGRRELAGPGSSAAQRRLAFLVGFLIVQSLFEPDFGSALRHLTPLLPIAVALFIARDDQRAVGVERAGPARWLRTGRGPGKAGAVPTWPTPQGLPGGPQR